MGQAKRPINKNLGEEAKCPIDKNLGEEAKCPIDKNSLAWLAQSRANPKRCEHEVGKGSASSLLDMATLHMLPLTCGLEAGRTGKGVAW